MDNWIKLSIFAEKKMKKIYITMVMFAAFGSIACKSNTNQQDKQVTPVEKTDGEKFAEAYGLGNCCGNR